MLRWQGHKRIFLCAIALVVWADIAQAQWVLLARRAIGRVEQMSQTSQDGKTTYDTATVMVEVPVDRVYDTVQRSVRAAQGITVTNEDRSARRIEFTNGTQIAYTGRQLGRLPHATDGFPRRTAMRQIR